MSTPPDDSAPPPRRVLPLIILAQFLGTSLWLVGNAVADEVAAQWPGVEGAVGWLTSSVQLGFIAGTLVYAVLALADRFDAPRVFFASSLLAAAANALTLLAPERFGWFLAGRFATGVFLAGIYPVGMKLAASWYRRGLGHAIGLLVGALVLGTAFPHLLRTTALPFGPVILSASVLAATGGLLVRVGVPEGPFVRRQRGLDPRVMLSVFRDPSFLRASLGYFGHMWELYALWALVPWALAVASPGLTTEALSLWSFLVIAAGALGCAAGGIASTRWGSARVAIVQLSISGLCCALSPWVLSRGGSVALAMLLIWGVTVAGDSPQLSTLGARTAPPDRVGTALTVMTMIGFSITIGSIQLLSALARPGEPGWLLALLLPGPVLGLWALAPLWRRDPTRA
ncbi:MAG: MFS transporter [Myxococcales bacterium]|nr:MFS transporter [Myxococcales bacterium]